MECREARLGPFSEGTVRCPLCFSPLRSRVEKVEISAFFTVHYLEKKKKTFHRDLGTASNWWPQGKYFRCGQNNYFSEDAWALLLDGKWPSFAFTHQQWLETGNQYSESFLSESYISRHFECPLKSLRLVGASWR